jgi:hypothetical protein
MITEKAFIIPNPVGKASSVLSDLEWSNGRLYRQTGLEFKVDDLVIQVNVKAWERYGAFQEAIGVEFNEYVFDRTKEGRQIGFFAEYWPLKFFEGHKEGDIITLTSPEYGVTYQLQLEQQSSPYKNISGTVVTEGGGLGIVHLGDGFTFERALDLVMGRGEFA